MSTITRQTDEILASWATAVENGSRSAAEAIQEAFDLGRQHGRVLGMEEVRRSLDAVFSGRIAIVEVPAGWSNPNQQPTTCRMELVEGVEPPVVIVTELAVNEGLSVTNNAEAIHADMVRRHGPAVRVVEHYDEGSLASGRRLVETFDLVTIGEGGHVHWRHLAATRDDALAALDRQR